MRKMAKAARQLLPRGPSPTKFSPQRIQQIKNLVEQGLGRDEIAKLLDVTVGSLQATCSRLGISLRRSKSRKESDASLSIRIEYKGEEQTVKLPLPEPIFCRLAREAEFRHVRIEELICGLIIATLRKNLLQLVLGPQSDD